jgi:tRNA/tmRNA/rRNA uracil-C5-methylase (TrmA/RlmC/RlmD family)
MEGVEPAEVLPPLRGQQYGYRHSARPNVRFVPDRKEGGGRVLVGFRHKWVQGSQPIDTCEVLAEPINSFFQEAAEVITCTCASCVHAVVGHHLISMMRSPDVT